METIQLKVDGMSCGSCVASVTRALQRVPRVEAVEVDLPEGIARVTAPDAAAKVPAMIANLAAAGYEAVRLSAPEGAAAPHVRHQRDAAGGCGADGASGQTGGCCRAH